METYQISREEYQAFLHFKKLVAEKPMLADMVNNEAFWKELSALLSLAYATKSESEAVLPSESKKEKVSIRKSGSGKHLVGFIADDFDDPLPEFAEYM